MSASRTMFITSLGGSAKTGPAARTANAPAMAAVLICSSFQKIFGRRMAVDVEHHRDQRVVARHADQVDDAALAKALEHRLVGGVAHELLFVQLGAEVVDGCLVVLHGRRAAPLRKIRSDARRKTRLQRERVMRVPLVLRAPVARRDEDREFVQARRQRAVEADVLAHLLRAVGELRAAQQRVERAAHAAARAAGDLLVHLALRLAHLRRRQRLEAPVHKPSLMTCSTILPRTRPLWLSACARRASASGKTFSTSGFTRPASICPAIKPSWSALGLTRRKRPRL